MPSTRTHPRKTSARPAPRGARTPNVRQGALQASHPSSLAGKSVLLTGGTTGIGRATAKRLAREGANVLVFGRDERDLAEALRDLPQNVLAIPADVTSDRDLDKIFRTVDRQFGRLDVLVNNAAVAGDDFDEGSFADWQRTIDTNILGYFACAHHALPRLRANGAGGGHIVCVGSMSADAREESNQVYAATKAAVQALCESLRKSVTKENVRVSLIEPGAIDTPMQGDDTKKKQAKVASGRMLDPDEIAEAILFTLTRRDRCDVVTMQVRPVNQAI